MKVLLMRDWYGPTKDTGLRQCKAGERVSVLHFNAAKLLRRHIGKWIAFEDGDPVWAGGNPPEVFCATAQERQSMAQADTMIRKAMNK